MITNKEIKLIRSLNFKKYREIHQSFMAEGAKIVESLISGGAICNLLIIRKNHFQQSKILSKNDNLKIVICEDKIIKKISNQKTLPKMIGVFSILKKKINQKSIKNSLSLLFEDMQDPGNFGAIIRTAEWFGIENIFCSKDCVDIYSPKVVQASMGAIINVNVCYVNLEELITKFRNEVFPIYGTFLNGENAFLTKLPKNGFILFGNEGHGISASLEKFVDKKIFIPPEKCTHISESLNLAAASTVICTLYGLSKY